MNSSGLKIEFKKELILLIGVFMLNCLPYVKASRIISEKELNRQPDQTKSEYSIDYKVTSKGVLYSLIEMNVAYEKVKKEKEFKVSRIADTSSENVACVITREKLENDTYWSCMLYQPLRTMGLGYVVTIPIMLYDWITYPFYTAFSTSDTNVVEESVSVGKKEIQSPKAKLKLMNLDTKFDKTYSFQNGKVEIPFSELHVNNLWNSGDEESGKKFYYYFSVLDLAGNQVIPETVFNGVRFREDQNFTKLSNIAYDKDRQTENNRCLKKFGTAIEQGIKYIDDNGVSLRKDDLIVKIILGKACNDYKGTNAHEACVNDFYDCITPVRYISNKNLKYEKE